MDEKAFYPSAAPSDSEKASLLPQFTSAVKVKSADPLPAGAPARPPTTPQGAAAAIRRAGEEENRRIDFIQRLVPSYIPAIPASSTLATSPTSISSFPHTPAPSAPASRSLTEQDEEKQKAEFIQRLVPGYVPIISADEARMGHLTTPPRSNGSAVMMTVLAGVALLWFMLTATGGLEFHANCSGDMRQEVATGAGVEAVGAKRLVPLEAHVMSKCPDTKVCHLSRLPFPSSNMQQLMGYVGLPQRAGPPRHGAYELQGRFSPLLLRAPNSKRWSGVYARHH